MQRTIISRRLILSPSLPFDRTIDKNIYRNNLESLLVYKCIIDTTENVTLPSTHKSCFRSTECCQVYERQGNVFLIQLCHCSSLRTLYFSRNLYPFVLNSFVLYPFDRTKDTTTPDLFFSCFRAYESDIDVG